MSKKKITYTDAPVDFGESIYAGEITADFLPPPEKLVRKEPKVKVTIALDSGSIDFFKRHAKKNHVKYQTMINEVLGKYVRKYSGPKAVK